MLTGDTGQTRDPSPKPNANACARETHTPEADAANQDDGGGGGGGGGRLARVCARQVTFAGPSAPPVIQEPGKMSRRRPLLSAPLLKRPRRESSLMAITNSNLPLAARKEESIKKKV